MISSNRTGFWINEEGEVGKPDPYNLYRYVGNNPTNATDPTGLVRRFIEFYANKSGFEGSGVSLDSSGWTEVNRILQDAVARFAERGSLLYVQGRGTNHFDDVEEGWRIVPKGGTAVAMTVMAMMHPPAFMGLQAAEGAGLGVPLALVGSETATLRIKVDVKEKPFAFAKDAFGYGESYVITLFSDPIKR